MRHAILVAVLGAAVGWAAALPSAVTAQQRFDFVGPSQCLNCHDHTPEKQWYENKELVEVKRLFPEKGANAGHINSLTQLDTPKSDEFAKAIGLADKYDVNGACVRCHATVFQGDANGGVSCESCHGPGSGYLRPHQTKGTYDQAVAQYGMTRLIGNLQGWVQQCTNCHVMDDDRLIKAGHPAGDDFDLAKKYVPVSLHFKKSYTAEQVDAVAKPAMDGIIRRRRPNSAPIAPISTLPPMTTDPAVGGAPGALAPPPPPPPAGGTTATPPPAPRRTTPARPRPAVDPSLPPPGSPTSIEPPPPLPGDPAPPPVTPPPAATPATQPVTSAPPLEDESSNFLATNWPWLTVVIVLLIGGLIWMRRR
jgi:hypothetical protein